MKKAIILFLAFFIYSGLYSQDKKNSEAKFLDSVNHILETSKVDSVYLKSLTTVVKFYRKKNQDTAISLINKGIGESIKRSNLKYHGQFLAYKGRYYRLNKELDSSIFYYELAMDKFLRHPDSIGYMGTVISFASALNAQGKYEGATTNFIKAINYFGRFPDEKNQKRSIIGKINLAGIYIPLNEYEKGTNMLSEIVDHPIVKSSKKMYGIICINQVAFLTGLGKEDEALYYANEAEKITTNKQSLANLYNNIGAMYNNKREFVKSIKYFKKSLNKFQDIKSTSGIIKSYNNLGALNTELRQFDKTEEYLIKAQNLIEQNKNVEILSIKGNYNGFISLYEKKGDFKKAYEYKNKLVQLSDSLLGLDTKKALLELETKYETDKTIKEKQIAEANELISIEKAENSRKRSVGALIFAGAIALLLIFIFNRLKVIRKQKKELDDAYERLEESKRFELAASNLKALKSQMNPHFIFNSLNSIQDLILEEDTDTSYDYIVLFSELVRNTLNYSDNDFIPIEKEMEFLKVYLELEKLRFGDEFQYTIEGEDIKNIKVPSLIIQPFLENSFKHGLLHKDGIKEISLNFNLGKELICTIIDNGVGRAETLRIQERRGTKVHESFAMGAIKKRLDLLSERFEENFSFEIEDLYEYEIASGTKITVIIPFEEEF